MQTDLQPILDSLREAIEIMNKQRVTAHERRYVRSILIQAEHRLTPRTPTGIRIEDIKP